MADNSSTNDNSLSIHLQRQNAEAGVADPMLTDLIRLPLPDRSRYILKDCGGKISSVVSRLLSAGAPLSDEYLVERIAWALAFNVVGVRNEEDLPKAAKNVRSYRERWNAETRWSVVWSKLTNDLTLGLSGWQPLEELLLSVACEQRIDWHPPERPPDQDVANRVFEYTYDRDRSKVVGDVRRTFGDRSDNPESVCSEAWARAYCTYWSNQAKRRFLGLSRISTLVCQIARYVAIDSLRSRERERSISLDDFDESGKNGLLIAGLDFDPEIVISDKQSHDRLKRCLKSLPARQRIVAEMVWVRGLKSKQVAEALGISEAAVSQQLRKARDLLRGCMPDATWESARLNKR